MQSSVSVYGASPRDPAKFTEEMSPRVQPRTGFGKDSIEIETYVRGLARRRPDVVVTTLRLATLMGAGVDSQVTRYLSLPVVPRVLGFDARLQFLHPDDAVAALMLVTREDVPRHLQRRRARRRHADPGRCARWAGPRSAFPAGGAAASRDWSGRPG